MRGGMSVSWGDGCTGGWEFQGGWPSVPEGWEFQGGWVFQGDGSSRGGWVFQGDGSSRGMGVPGGWAFQGDGCSGGWVSRGMGVPDTQLNHPMGSVDPKFITQNSVLT